MQWLNDKKNQPYVIGGVVLVLVIVLLMALKPWNRGGGTEEAAQTPEATPTGPPGMPGAGTAGPPGMPPGMPGAGAPGAGGPMAGGAATPAGPGAAAAAPTAAPAETGTKSKPMEPWRDDPFLPAGVKQIKKVVFKPVPRILDFPFPEPFTFVERGKEAEAPPKPQPSRRMAGILLNSRIFAIIETDGKDEVVQPGDMLADRLAVVERVERDRVILKTTDKKPRTIVLRLASASKEERRSTPGGYGGEIPGGEATPGGVPGMPPPGMPGMPGMPGGMPPPPPMGPM